MSLKDKLTIKALMSLAPNPDRKSNNGTYLYRIWFWQTINGIAKKELEKAWKEAQDNGVVPTDDVLRDKYEGGDETIVADSDCFSCSIKVAEAGQRFDLETFLENISRKFKIPMPKLVAISADSKKPVTAALTKKVLEATDAN